MAFCDDAGDVRNSAVKELKLFLGKSAASDRIKVMKRFKDFITVNQEAIFLSVAIILVGLIGFGLGRLSSKYQTAELNIKSTLVNTTDLNKIATGDQSQPAQNQKKTINVTAGVQSVVEQPGDREVIVQKVVGNKQSKIYHLENCSGALRMSESNKVFFDSISAAKEAGYRPAGNCPGLE